MGLWREEGAALLEADSKEGFEIPDHLRGGSGKGGFQRHLHKDLAEEGRAMGDREGFDDKLDGFRKVPDGDVDPCQEADEGP